LFLVEGRNDNADVHVERFIIAGGLTGDESSRTAEKAAQTHI